MVLNSWQVWEGLITFSFLMRMHSLLVFHDGWQTISAEHRDSF